MSYGGVPAERCATGSTGSMEPAARACPPVDQGVSRPCGARRKPAIGIRKTSRNGSRSQAFEALHSRLDRTLFDLGSVLLVDASIEAFSQARRVPLAGALAGASAEAPRMGRRRCLGDARAARSGGSKVLKIRRDPAA